jgi:hypothetical protein
MQKIKIKALTGFKSKKFYRQALRINKLNKAARLKLIRYITAA